MGILIGTLTILLVLLSIFLVLVVLMQRGSANGGLGAAMGGGAAESAFGAETSDVLSKITRNVAIVFFVGTFGLYLAVLWSNGQAKDADANALPEFENAAGVETSAFPAIPTESIEAAAVDAEEAATAAATEVEEKAEEAIPAQ